MNQQGYYQELQAGIDSMPRYTILPKTIRASQYVKVEQGCYGFFAINMGDVLVTIDEFPLLPRVAAGLAGGWFGWSDHTRLFVKNKVNVLFTAGGTDPQVVITQICIV